MTSTRKYTMTVRQVLNNLGILTDAYEKMSAGASYFAINATDAAATLKASHQLISLVPVWIPVGERLPEEGEPVLWHHPADTFCHAVVGKRDGDSIDWGSDLNMDIARNVTHWMPLPEPPEVK